MCCCTTLESQTVCPFKCFELRLFAVHVVFDEFFRNGIGGHHNWHDSITTTILNSYADFYDSWSLKNRETGTPFKSWFIHDKHVVIVWIKGISESFKSKHYGFNRKKSIFFLEHLFEKSIEVYSRWILERFESYKIKMARVLFCLFEVFCLKRLHLFNNEHLRFDILISVTFIKHDIWPRVMTFFFTPTYQSWVLTSACFFSLTQTWGLKIAWSYHKKWRKYL